MRHTIRKSRDRDLGQHPGRLRGEAMQRYQGCTWSRESGADDGTLLDSSVMSSAMAERLASKSLQDQRPGRKCLGPLLANISEAHGPVLPDTQATCELPRPGKIFLVSFFFADLQLTRIRLTVTVLFGPP